MFSATCGNHQPHKTRFGTKTALQVQLLQMYMHIQNMHTHNCRLLLAAKEVFIKILRLLQTLQPHKGAHKELTTGIIGLSTLKVYFLRGGFPRG